MPNTGKPSRDCHLCRSRRVKCDLGRPACQRCIKYGAECPGYRSEHDLVFRHSNPSTVKRRKKRTQQASREVSTTTTSTSTSASSSSSPASWTTPATEASTPPIFLDDDFDRSLVPSSSGDMALVQRYEAPLELPPPLHEHWTTHSIPIILNVYDGVDFLQSMYRKNLGDGPLVWAAHLFTRTYVTNLRYSTARCNESLRETDQELAGYLAKTLKSVSAALKSPDGAVRDDVFATVWILANYELLVGSIGREDVMSPWHLHTRGLYNLLRTRGSQSLHTETGRQAFWPAYNLIQVQCLLTNTECPPESDEWLEIVKAYQGPMDGLGLQVCIYITKACHAQARMLKVLRDQDFAAASAEYRHLVDTMAQAEDGIATFLGTRTLDSIHDPYMKNMLFSARVKCYQFLFFFVNFLTHHVESPIPFEELKALRSYCEQVVSQSCQEIVNAIPTTLGPLRSQRYKSPKALFDALKLIWPLTAVTVITSATEEHRKAAHLALQFIGKELGVRQALRVHPGRFPLPREAREPLGITEV